MENCRKLVPFTVPESGYWVEYRMSAMRRLALARAQIQEKGT